MLYGGFWIIGGFINYFLNKYGAYHKTLMISVSITSLSIFTMLYLAQTQIYQPWAVIAPMMGVYLTMPMIFSNSFIGSIAEFKSEAGTAAAIISTLQFSFAALVKYHRNFTRE